ncbi:hypothetical protein SAY86_007845 [Trapa natans]|uniref:H15 domain-containing protein n=1 Tax=Trapa natans TaxID=22666 RepID=A0AAN7LMF5_TRANT|nr:hypothetical protein SAY86_007845 [Trapa natans]
MATASATKAKAMASVKKKVSPPSHPPFYEMIADAIATLKERTGSSQYAIQKFIEENHKGLPSTFRKLLLFQLKRLVASGKLVKVKNSFKLSLIAKQASVTSSKKPVEVDPKKKVPTKNSKAKADDAAAKPKPKPATGKRKVGEKPKAKAGAAAAKPTKVAKTSAKASPGKKAVRPKKVAVKRPTSVKSPMKKPKSGKSPAKKAKK